MYNTPILPLRIRPENGLIRGMRINRWLCGISIFIVASHCMIPLAQARSLDSKSDSGRTLSQAVASVAGQALKRNKAALGSGMRAALAVFAETSKRQQRAAGGSLGSSAVASPLGARGLVIVSVRGRRVRVHVPKDFESVTLEQMTSFKKREWKNVGTKAVRRTGGTVEFQLPRAVARKFLRVSGRAAPPRGGDFMNGPSLFLADPALARSGAPVTGGLDFPVYANASTSVPTETDTATRTVSESDIWCVAGDRLYFFNSLRGLQVLDIANPDDPALLGQLRAPGVGEQMYLLDSTHVALLTRGTDFLRLAPAAASIVDAGSSDGSVLLVDVSQDKPEALAGVSYRGWLRESRLVGTVLYVVSEVYETRRHGLEVTSFDLSDPAHPVKRDNIFLGSWGGVIHATDRFLFVVRYSGDWARSIIDVVDISSPVGALNKRGQIGTAGRVDDKFKMHLDGDTFTVVSAVPRLWNAPANDSRTMVETFSLANPDAPAALGSLELGVGETVRATRFDGQRLYVVTFLQIDPLWVVDLANPADPTLLGELHVPGFSNYIEPLGDRLVAVGRVDNQTVVSLFDVSDPAHPVALSQLPLGDGYSWSEANWDEKAFSVLPGENLILVPYSGYDSASGFSDRVQLIDLEQNALTKRGVIDHGFAARRTTVKGNRILAISATNLVTVDFADRDHPAVTSDVELAWRVDRVLLSGEYLLQLGGSADYRGKRQTLAVSKASAPDTALATVNLDDATVIGATVRDGRLYVAQQNTWSYWGWVRPVALVSTGGATGKIAANANPFILSVFDLSSLPEAPLLARTKSDASLGSNAGNLSAVWPRPGVLVWVRSQSNYWGWGYGGGPVFTLADAAPTARMAVLPWWGNSDDSDEMLAFDVSVPTAPVLAAKLKVRTGATGDWSEPFAAGGKLYVSSMAYDDPPKTVRLPSGSAATPSRLHRHFLKTVDFRGPADPVVGLEVGIPGRLEGLSRDGSLLYTFGPSYAGGTEPTEARALHASGFDGDAAHFVDQLGVADGESFALDGDTLLITTRAGVEESATHKLQAWLLSGSGEFRLTGEIQTPWVSLAGTLGGLLVATAGDDGVQHLYDVSVPAGILDLGEFAAPSWPDRSSLRKADGGAGRGLWYPSGSYGIDFIEFGN
jgi:hypothetical protein